jgi:hypothetical protein
MQFRLHGGKRTSDTGVLAVRTNPLGNSVTVSQSFLHKPTAAVKCIAVTARLSATRVHDYPGPRRDRDQIPAGFLNRDRWSRRVFLAGNAPSAYARHNLIAKQNLQKKKWRPRGRPSRQTVTANQLRKKAKITAAAVTRTHGLWVFKLALYH